ncbi:homeobox protein CDX-2-like [Ambystoma mexicanum]|uniref:homeobox protein CDX-2-like n=1 Tax=Ambystoma mexicanum TaxID=8296 RepID=UPI0037E723EF
MSHQHSSKDLLILCDTDSEEERETPEARRQLYKRREHSGHLVPRACGPAVKPAISKLKDAEHLCCSDTDADSVEEIEACNFPSAGHPVITSVFSLRESDDEELQPSDHPEGHPIITSVFTLRGKEEDALQPSGPREVGHPVITSVFSLRENKAQELHPLDHQEGGTRTNLRYRTPYTGRQLAELEKEFRTNRYITSGRKEELVASLGLTNRQVKIWFQNRRAKEKRLTKCWMEQLSQYDDATTPLPPMGNSSVGDEDVSASPPSSETVKEENEP